MNKLNSFKDSSSKSKHSDENSQNEKVLCNHCGRTSHNGIRCLGMCVADNDY